MALLKIVFTSLLLTALAFPSQSQNNDSLAIIKYYDANAILWQGGSHYYKNSVGYPVRKLPQEFHFSPDAMKEFKKYQTKHRIMIGGLIATTAFLVSSVGTRNHRVSYSTQFLVLSAITLGVSITFSLQSRKHLGKSVWYHNRDILIR